MNEIVVDKEALLAKLQENREAHRAIFEEALAGFRVKVIERLDQMIEAAKNNRRIDLVVGLQQPEDHTKEYDQVIAMLKMDIGQTVELEPREFAQYVLDDWGWRERFLTNNSYYSSTAQQILTASSS